MTVTELRKSLEKMEKDGKGDILIAVVSCQNCESIDPYTDMWTETDICAYEAPDGTIAISD